MEIWDAYYEDETLAGVDLIRDEDIPKGLYHGVAEIFVIHEDGSVLLMQRDWNKKGYPGFWESGAGGSILKGESFLEGAKRELLEETGYISEDWQYLGATVESSAKLTNYMHIYFANHCRKVSGQHLDATEELDVLLVPLGQAVEMVMDNEICCNSSAHGILRVARMLGV